MLDYFDVMRYKELKDEGYHNDPLRAVNFGKDGEGNMFCSNGKHFSISFMTFHQVPLERTSFALIALMTHTKTIILRTVCFHFGNNGRLCSTNRVCRYGFLLQFCENFFPVIIWRKL